MTEHERETPQTLIAIFRLSWLAFLLLWSLAFFTPGGWRLFTDFTAFAGRTQLLGKALWEAREAGAGPTPAPVLLWLATLWPLLGFALWALRHLFRHLSRPHDPYERFRPHRGMTFGHMQLKVVLLLLFAEVLLGFPTGLALLGPSILYAPGAALACATLLMLVTSLSAAVSIRWRSA